MRGQRGFTLVEVLAAGIISVIVSGAVLSVLKLTNDQLKESAARLALGQMQTAVLDQFRVDARRSFAAKSGAESPGATFAADDPRDDAAIPNIQEIFFCDLNGSATSRYRINTSLGYLEEWDGTIPGYVPFRVVGQVVTVDPANSRFGVLPGRRGVTYQIATRLVSGATYSSPLIQETMYIRNGQ